MSGEAARHFKSLAAQKPLVHVASFINLESLTRVLSRTLNVICADFVCFVLTLAEMFLTLSVHMDLAYSLNEACTRLSFNKVAKKDDQAIIERLGLTEAKALIKREITTFGLHGDDKS